MYKEMRETSYGCAEIRTGRNEMKAEKSAPCSKYLCMHVFEEALPPGILESFYASAGDRSPHEVGGERSFSERPLEAGLLAVTRWMRGQEVAVGWWRRAALAKGCRLSQG